MLGKIEINGGAFQSPPKSVECILDPKGTTLATPHRTGSILENHKVYPTRPPDESPYHPFRFRSFLYLHFFYSLKWQVLTRIYNLLSCTGQLHLLERKE